MGWNARMDGIQAAILRVKLKRLEEENARRRENASIYRSLFQETGLGAEVGVPEEVAAETHVYHQFVIRAPRRDALREFLDARGIESRVFYPLPLHRQPALESVGLPAGSLPESERAAAEVLALPITSRLTPEDAEDVVGAIGAFYRG